MDWLRRNWPDLLIGVALVVVIAMIIVTLLSGGSLASLVRRDTPQPLTTDAGTGAAVTNSSASSTLSSNSEATAEGAGSLDTTADTSAGGGDTAADGYDVFVPGVPGRDATAADGGQDDSQSGETDAAELSSDASMSSITQTSDTSSGADAPLPTASRTGRFRVAAGATPSRDGASTLAQSYRDAGYEVTVEQKNDLYLLWVGPYGTRNDADAAAERIIAGGGDALVYSYDGESADAEAAADITAETSTEATPEIIGGAETGTAAPNAGGRVSADGTVLANNTSANVTPRTPAAGNTTTGNTATGNTATGNTATGTATLAGNNTGNNTVAGDLAAGAGSGERYLQVGAFASEASAAPRRVQLEQIGLEVTSSESAGGLLRLFVGPLGEAQLAQIQTRLTAQGIESFPVSQ